MTFPPRGLPSFWGYSRAELLQIRRDIDAALDALALEKDHKAIANKSAQVANQVSELQRKKAREVAIAASREVLKEYGLTLEDAVRLLNGKQTNAMYAKPGEPGFSWSGCGRRPLWVHQHLESGGTLDDLLIEGVEFAIYAKPGDPNITWCGYGRRPLWVHQCLESGWTLEALKTTGNTTKSKNPKK